MREIKNSDGRELNLMATRNYDPWTVTHMQSHNKREPILRGEREEEGSRLLRLILLIIMKPFRTVGVTEWIVDCGPIKMLCL